VIHTIDNLLQRLANTLAEARVKQGEVRKARKDEVFFWAPSRSSSVKPGMKVPPFKVPSSARDHLVEAERMAEVVRAAKYKDRPPREGSVMVCPTLEGFCGGYMFKGRPVFMVKVKGTIFTTDGDAWTDVAANMFDFMHGLKNPDGRYGQSMDDFVIEKTHEIQTSIDTYWRGASRDLPETLVDGTVTVIREVAPDKIKAIRKARNQD